jgi:hypothetical protein
MRGKIGFLNHQKKLEQLEQLEHLSFTNYLKG